VIIDSKDPSLPLEKFVYNETRYRMLMQSNPERAETLLHQAEASVRARWQHYKELAALSEVKAEHDGH
jgi:hypothetical protein